MLRPWLFVGFSGHRKLDDPALIARAVREALQKLAGRTQAPLAAVSSCAAGADTIFAEAVAEADLPWTLLLPFPIEVFQKDFDDDPAAWERVEALRPRAVRTVVEPPTQERSDAYLECGVRTVDECDVLLTVWNGEAAAGRGGTGDVVAYARTQGKTVWWIHSETGALVEERSENIPEPVSPPKQGISAALAAVTPARLAGTPAPSAPAQQPRPETDGYALLEASYRRHNDAAKALRPRAMNLNLSLVYLHQISAAITLTTLTWYDQAWLQGPSGWVKLGLLFLAFVLPWFFVRAHTEWIHHRLRAELCRSALTIWRLPNPDEILPALRQPVEERAQRSVLLLRMLTRVTPLTIDEARTHFTAERIDRQLAYFEKQAATARTQRRWLILVGQLCTAGALLIGFAPMFGVLTEAMGTYRPWMNVGRVLPLVTTALLATVAARDLTRRAARYGELAAFLQRARIQLAIARTWPRLTRVVIDVERTLLLEIWEWYSLARFAPGR